MARLQANTGSILMLSAKAGTDAFDGRIATPPMSGVFGIGSTIYIPMASSDKVLASNHIILASYERNS